MKDLSSGSKGKKADTETVRVAMLSSPHKSEGRREFYFLRSPLLDCITSDSSVTVVDILYARCSYHYRQRISSRSSPTR